MKDVEVAQGLIVGAGGHPAEKRATDGDPRDALARRNTEDGPPLLLRTPESLTLPISEAAISLFTKPLTVERMLTELRCRSAVKVPLISGLLGSFGV